MAWEDKDIVTAIIAGLAVVVAHGAYLVSRRQLEVTRDSAKNDVKFTAAKRLSEATYKVRDEMTYCRAPFIDHRELNSPMRTPQEREQAYRKALGARWEPVRSALEELESASQEAEALFGSEVRTTAGALRQCARELYASIDSFIANEASGGEDFERDRDFGRKVRETAFADPNNNVLNIAIARAVEGIESTLKRHLGR